MRSVKRNEIFELIQGDMGHVYEEGPGILCFDGLEILRVTNASDKYAEVKTEWLRFWEIV